MITVAGIDHVVLRVRNLDAAVAFYGTILGCAVEKRNDAIGLVHLRAGTSLIDLVPVSGKLGAMGGAAPGLEGRNVDHICLRLHDYDPAAVMAHLTTHNISFDPPDDRYGAGGEGLSIYLRDPDGNGLELRG